MAKKYWFKAKNYGWGWRPSSWEGWAVLVIFIITVVANFQRINSRSHSVSDNLLNSLSQTFIFTIILIAICMATGEKPEWRWKGKKIKF